MEMNVNEREETLREYVSVLFRRKTTILLAMFLVMGAVFIGLQLKTPTYDAGVKMLILAKKQVESPYYRDMSDFRPSQINVTQSEMVKSNTVIERVVKVLPFLNEIPEVAEAQYASSIKAIFLDVKMKKMIEKFNKLSVKEREQAVFRTAVESLKKKIKVEPVKDTDLFVIEVSAYTPAHSAAIANAISRSYCIFDLEQQLGEVKQKYGEKHRIVQQLRDDIKKMESTLTSDSIPDVEAMGPASVKIIEQAIPPVDPSGLPKTLIMAIALIMSFFLGVVLSFTFEYFDTTVKTAQEVSKYLPMPLLGYIPEKRSLISRAILCVRWAVKFCLSIWAFIILLDLLISVIYVNDQNTAIQFLKAFSSPFLWMRNFLPGIKLPANIDINTLSALILVLAALYSTAKILSFLALKLAHRGLLINERKKTNSFAASFQNLSEQIYLLLKSSMQKSILVTSALAQEGKTVFSANLGFCLSNKANRKILLIDANVRKPKLHRLFKVENQNGLIEVLNGEIEFEAALEEVSKHLFLLPAGGSFHDSIMLFESPRINDLMKSAEKQFDLIIVDCANMRGFKDSLALSSHVDGMVLLIEQGKVRKEVLKAQLLPFLQKKCHFYGAVLNKRTFSIPGFLYNRV